MALRMSLTLLRPIISTINPKLLSIAVDNQTITLKFPLLIPPTVTITDGTIVYGPFVTTAGPNGTATIDTGTPLPGGTYTATSTAQNSEGVLVTIKGQVIVLSGFGRMFRNGRGMMTRSGRGLTFRRQS